jgi:hypothetical protein
MKLWKHEFRINFYSNKIMLISYTFKFLLNSFIQSKRFRKSKSIFGLWIYRFLYEKRYISNFK